MREIGIVRNVDELGRIVIPKEMRDVLDVATGDPMEIFSDEGTIFLRRYSTGCVFCGEMNSTINFKGRMVCRECLADLKK